ncbi:MAG TPA: hypothetical protein VMI53_00325 [Opitutaceae bacterium]|nr:hypothetical protein [Opitutaceae bacterium]
MSLADEVAKRKAQERADAAHRSNPELQARLDKFIAENPALYAHYNAMSKEELVQRQMRAKMQRENAEMVVRRNRELEQWVNENPEIVAKVEAHIKNKAAENRERPSIKIAKTKLVKQGMQGSRIHL